MQHESNQIVAVKIFIYSHISNINVPSVRSKMEEANTKKTDLDIPAAPNYVCTA